MGLLMLITLSGLIFTYHITVYPEILTVIKFGDLLEIRVYKILAEIKFRDSPEMQMLKLMFTKTASRLYI